MKNLIRRLLRMLPVTTRRRVMFLRAHRRVPNFRTPRTFSEKLNWRILYDKRPILSWTCDKSLMKTYVEENHPEVKVPRTLWTGTQIEELSTFDFPNRWIINENHRSQCVLAGKGTPELELLRSRTRGWLDSFQSEQLGEWAYSQAEPTIILEEWIGSEDHPPEDYKFFVFDGSVHMIQVDTDRFTGHRRALFDREWNQLPVRLGQFAVLEEFARPPRLDEMISVAEAIGGPFDFMRVDLFLTPKGIYLGETSPYPGGGIEPFTPTAFDLTVGSLWKLPKLEAQ